MKRLLYLVIISFTFIGCTSTYTVQKFSSKENFYNDFNNSAGDKTAKIVLNDSIPLIVKGISIEDDTLYKINIGAEQRKEKIPLSLVSNIKYDVYYSSAIIELTNDEKLNAKHLQSFEDSLEFLHLITTKSIIAPVKQLDYVSYKKRWLGVPFGFAAGIVAGAGIGAIFLPVYTSRPDMTNGGEKWERDHFSAMIYGAVSGAVIGAILGWIVGYDYIYKFN